MSKLTYFDIHGHINFPEYDADCTEVIKRARQSDVGIISVGTDLDSSRKVVAIAEQNENVWAIVGIHPTDTQHVSVSDMQELAELAKHPKVVAIGECGLDYFHSKPEDIDKQRAVFVEHINVANEIRKPLMLHVRNARSAGVGNAYQEAISLLRQHSRVRANFHFFAGSVADAQDIVSMGNTISFTGVLTFAREYDEVVRTVPLTSIMSETDCPFVAPVPYRGTRNEPSYVVEVVQKIAEIRREDVSTVSAQLAENARKLFGIIE